jgi:hypothetical protein
VCTVPRDEAFDTGYDLAEWREIAKQAQWDSLNAYGDLLTRVAPDGWPRRLADLNVRYYEELLKGTQSLTDQWLDAVERAMPSRPDDRAGRHGPGGRSAHSGRHEHHEPAAPTGERRRVPMSLHAPAGETGRGSLSLQNKTRTDTEVSFLVSDFTSSDGASIRPVVNVLPERFWLGPLEERVVVLEVALEPELFPPGKLFHGAVAVRGYDDLELDLTVWADEADEADA